MFKRNQKATIFALDLNLYLDNFPNCKNATDDYKVISSKLRKLIWDYEQDYGPLTNFGSSYIQNPDAWIDSPWPWEKESNKEE